MKKIAFALLALAFAGTAHAAGSFGGGVPFSNYSAADGNAVYSRAYPVKGFKTKTVQVTGINSSNAATTLSGTLLAQVGPTASGPWTTAVQQDGTSVSMTSNGVLSWDDAAGFVRLSWAKTAGKVKAWLDYIEY